MEQEAAVAKLLQLTHWLPVQKKEEGQEAHWSEFEAEMQDWHVAPLWKYPTQRAHAVWFMIVSQERHCELKNTNWGQSEQLFRVAF